MADPTNYYEGLKNEIMFANGSNKSVSVVVKNGKKRVPNVEVQFSIVDMQGKPVTNMGTLDPTSATTDENGIATTTLTAPDFRPSGGGSLNKAVQVQVKTTMKGAKPRLWALWYYYRTVPRPSSGDNVGYNFFDVLSLDQLTKIPVLFNSGNAVQQYFVTINSNLQNVTYAGQRAADIVFNNAQQCGLNPALVLSTMEKEQTLLSIQPGNLPSNYQHRLDFAMGYGTASNFGAQLQNGCQSYQKAIAQAPSMPDHMIPAKSGPQPGKCEFFYGRTYNLRLFPETVATCALYIYNPQIIDDANGGIWLLFYEWYKFKFDTLTY